MMTILIGVTPTEEGVSAPRSAFLRLPYLNGSHPNQSNPTRCDQAQPVAVTMQRDAFPYSVVRIETPLHKFADGL